MYYFWEILFWYSHYSEHKSSLHGTDEDDKKIKCNYCRISKAKGVAE